MIKIIFLLGAFVVNSCSTVRYNHGYKDVEEFKLENGIKVILRKNNTSEVVSFRVAFKGGVYELNENNAGVESLLMDLSLKGTSKFPKEKLNKMFFKYGIGISPLNQPDLSVYRVKSLKKYFPIALDVLVDIFKNPLFDKKEFEILKEKNLAALKAELDSPDSLVDKRLKDYFFEGHPYYLREIGRINSVSKITLESIKEHHKKMLDASRIVIVVVGNFEAKNLKNDLENYLGNIPNKSRKYEIVSSFKNESRPKTIITPKENVPNAIVEGIFKAPGYMDPDYEPLLIASNILNRRLWLEIRTNKALVYSSFAGLSSKMTNYGILYFSSRQPKKAIRAVNEVINKMKNELVSEDELKDAIESYVTSYWQENETLSSQGGNLAFFEITAGGYERYFSFMKRIFYVNPTSIKMAMGKYYKNISFSIVGETSDLRESDFMIK